MGMTKIHFFTGDFFVYAVWKLCRFGLHLFPDTNLCLLITVMESWLNLSRNFCIILQQGRIVFWAPRWQEFNNNVGLSYAANMEKLLFLIFFLICGVKEWKYFDSLAFDQHWKYFMKMSSLQSTDFWRCVSPSGTTTSWPTTGPLSPAPWGRCCCSW